jgi:3-oxoacyl-[acyl-carrier protein] reductase
MRALAEVPCPGSRSLSRSIAGRTAIVTGAASGMGRATAHLFADEGARVAVVDRDDAGVARVVEEIEKAGGTARASRVDVGDTRSSASWARRAERLGPIDILINKAGIVAGGPLDAPTTRALGAARASRSTCPRRCT